MLAFPDEARAQGAGAFQGRTIEKVEWQGLERVSHHQMQQKIATREGGALDAPTLSKDMERLFRTGEFESEDPRETPVSVEVVLANPANAAGPVKVIFHCHERGTVGKVTFDDSLADALKRSDVDETVKTKKGSLFDSYRVKLDASELRAKVVEKGYLHAEIAPVTTKTESGVSVKFQCRLGPKVHVEEIVFDMRCPRCGEPMTAEDETCSRCKTKRDVPDPRVVKDLDGPNAMETKERKLFGLLESGFFDRRALRRDLDRVARYYRSLGYLDAKVYLDRYESSDDRSSLKVHIRVDEGERYTVSGVSLEGVHVFSKEKIVAELKMRPGRPLLGEDLRADIDKIKRLYGDRAYIHAEVDVDFRYDVTRKLLDVTFRVSEGPKVRIDRIRIEGNDKTRENVIRRDLSFYPGEYFDATKFEESYARLARKQYWKDIRWDFEPGSEPGREDFVLRVEEQRTGQFTIGGGISSNAGVFGNIALRQSNFDITAVPTSWRDVIDGHAFSGAGQLFAIQFSPGKDRSQYRVTFEEPWLLGYPVIFGVEGYIFDRNYGSEEWSENRIGGSV
ncbi:hypothetical protein HY251_19885, partial [bacterium]|nr:hypothetical protein [bacterium]